MSNGPRAKEALRLWSEGMTQAEVAREMGVSRQRVGELLGKDARRAEREHRDRVLKKGLEVAIRDGLSAADYALLHGIGVTTAYSRAHRYLGKSFPSPKGRKPPENRGE